MNAHRLIDVENLSVSLPRGSDREWAVRELNLDIRAGEILCVIGESGSGKSVLSRAIMGALPRGLRRSEGRIVLGDRILTDLSERQWRTIRGKDIAMISQEPMVALNPGIRVGRQIDEVFRIHTPGIPRSERQARVIELMAETHLAKPEVIADRFPHQLSGGEAQRIAIAMALALHPKLLIADEATTALDVTTQAQILRLIRELRDVHGHGVLFITHDFGVVAEIADRIAVMRTGRIVESGTKAQVLGDPQHDYTRMLISAVPSLKPLRSRSAVAAAPILSIRNLSKRYDQFLAVDSVSFDVAMGSTVAIVGESGSGKSTLARMIIGLVKPSAGHVEVRIRDNGAAKEDVGRSGRRSSIQMVFQDPFGSLNPRHKVGYTLTRACILAGMDRETAAKRVAQLIELVGLSPEALERYPRAFSGGQRQRICIARALARDPDIILADESVSALDVSIQRQVLELFATVQRDRGVTSIFITHDLRVAAQIADEIGVMQRGKIVEFGPAREVLESPKHAYTAELIRAIPGRAEELALVD